MRCDVISVFPEYLAPLQLSLLGKAAEAGLTTIRVHDLRDFATDRHRTVDDTPYGGGPGMVMRADIWGAAIDAVLDDGRQAGLTSEQATLVIPTPSGRSFSATGAEQLAQRDWLILACGRYEGIDDRVAQHYRQFLSVQEVSIGDYVLAGGEAAALVILEATLRLLPGVLGNPESAHDDSFAPNIDGRRLLEGPVYTKPRQWRELAVPEVLLGGNHAAIAAWRQEQAQERTRLNRPDLLPES